METGHQGMPPSLYSSAPRSNSSSSSSPPSVTTATSSASMLVVPQPINATKMSSGVPPTLSQQPSANGTGRKYQCKMCPQVGVSSFRFSVLSNPLLISFLLLQAIYDACCFFFAHFFFNALLVILKYV